MIVLALDTTGPHCAAALSSDGVVLAHKSERIGRGHAERLAPMVMEVMQAAGLAPAQVNRLAVCTGPGSFTGLRVALSYAKGFALPRKLPVLGVDALQIAAWQIADAQDDQRIAVFRDVRRGQVFAATYSHGKPSETPRAMTMEEAQSAARTFQVALHEAEEADVRTLAKRAVTLDPAAYPAVPLYARAPDAKLPGGITLPAI